MKYKILVTQEDIDKGRRHDPHQCAVAKAVRRTVANKKVVSVTTRIYVGDKAMLILPEKVKDFIQKFDSVGRKAVKPFSFTLVLK